MPRQKRPPTGRPPGRPHVETHGVRVSTFVRAADYDRLCELARKRDDGSVSGALRDLLVQELRRGERRGLL